MKHDDQEPDRSDAPASGRAHGRDPSPESDVKWRIVAVVIVLAALAALVYKQSF